MFARFQGPTKTVARLFAMVALLFLAACDGVPLITNLPGSGPTLTAGQPVQVALLVPAGSAAASDEFLAQNLENAARLAIADLSGVQIDLRVYATAGNPVQAAQAAAAAVADGANIILGPLYGEAANAAGITTAGSGVNVLAFSNNPTIAGGNVFILGSTFASTAQRLVSYGRGIGIDNYLVVHADDLQGSLGRDAIAAAVRRNGGTLSAIESYALTQDAIIAAAPRISQAARSSGAQAVFFTAGVNADLPILATILPENGLSPQSVQYMGLTRWSAAPQALALPGLQGGIFALPDQSVVSQFESRYAAAYGALPHPLAGLAFDGIAAIGALAARGNPDALSRASLTQAQGFQGTSGIFRLLADGTNERGLAVAEIRNNQVVIIDAAPRSFSGAGF
ncbi:MAG: penicillin-binding protein activator [Rhodobacteraceae bacterium]|nr:penicillin-binding protein activator [Paracoccaceae bacterium]